MKHVNPLLLTVFLFCALCVQARKAGPVNNASIHKPFLFIENKGQVHDLSGSPQPSALYALGGNNMSVILEKNAVHYTFFKALGPTHKLQAYRLDMTLSGASAQPVITGEEKQVYQENFYLQNGTVVTNAKSYKKIIYHNVYPHIDWVVYLKNEQLEYDFIVHPQGKPSDIKLVYNGAADVVVQKNGSLHIGANGLAISEKMPFAYIKESGRAINCRFEKTDKNSVRFNTAVYNGNSTLVIDPTIAWATYFGGTASTSNPTSYTGDDAGYGIATDNSGNVYMVGQTLTDGTSTNSGIMQGATTGNTVQQSAFAGGTVGGGDVFLVKFDSAGNRLWATYYGGSQNERGTSVACDASGNVFVGGYTNSITGISSSGSFQASIANSANIDAFLIKFNSTGTRQWGTYYGGSTGASRGTTVTCDASGNVYLGGYTATTSSGSVLATSGAFQTSSNATSTSNNDGFLAKFNTSGSRLWGTYYGGTADDKVYSVSCDASGNVFIGGATSSTDAATAANTAGSVASTGSQQTSSGGSGDAFLAKFNSSGARQWGTYYGSSVTDQALAVKCDASGNVYLGGSTNSGSTGLATSTASQPTSGGGTDALLVKFNASGVRQWATYYGGAGTDQINALAVDTSGNIFLGGQSSTTSGTNISNINTNAAGTRSFLAEFNAIGVRQFGTYFGGSTNGAGATSSDIAYGIACDAFGNAYLCGSTTSNNMPVTTGAYETTYSNVSGTTVTTTDAFLVKYRIFGQNLVYNPGFETTSSPWYLDNFAHNVASFSRTSDNPHSGSWCTQVNLTQVTGQSYLFYDYPYLRVLPNMPVQISFWARGVSNGATLSTLLRQAASPNTTYFRTEVGLSEEWQQYTFITVLPSVIDTSNVLLAFLLTNAGYFVIDDVSVTQLPAVQGGIMPTTNPIRNPSFEAGTDGWSATIRESEFGTQAQESGNLSPAPEGAKLSIQKDGTAPQGKQNLSISVNSNCWATITSAYFPARYGQPLNLSFYLRSDSTRAFSAGIGAGKNGSALYKTVGKTATTSWQHFVIPFTLQPAEGGVYTAVFQFNKPGGRFDIDAVTVVEQAQSSPVLYPPSVAIQASAIGPTANLFAPNQSASFRLVAAGATASSTQQYQISAFDYLENKVFDTTIGASFDTSGYCDTSFAVPTTKLGAFRLEARMKDSLTLLAEQLYSVLPALPDPSLRPNSYFGGHVDLTSYNLEIAKKAGFRWLRMWDPLMTTWIAAEPSLGVWNFPTTALANAHSQGFRISGMFGTAPDFAADIDSSGVSNRWSHSYPPKDLNDWKDYISRCYNAYSSYIDSWEVWNEPDGGFLTVKPGVDKNTVYYSLLNAARQVFDSTHNPVVLLGPALANMNDSLGWKTLAAGGNSLLDAFSFHLYGIGAGGNSPNVNMIKPILAQIQTYNNKAGVAMPLWHSEGGPYLSGGRSWLATYRVPPSSSVTMPQAAATTVRSALFLKAMGVQHYFDFALYASAAGRRIDQDATCSFIELTGIPGPAIAAHAAMVKFTEDGVALGFDTIAGNTNSVKVAHFRDSVTTHYVDVYWSGTATSLRSVASLSTNDQIFDMMGNPVDSLSAATGEFPLYVVRGDSGSEMLAMPAVEFSAVPENDHVKLVWNTSNEKNMKNFEVLKSENSQVFSAIGKVDAKNNVKANNYSLLDNNKLVGTNYYRLKIIDLDGKVNYSSIVAVSRGLPNDISVYPNIVTKSAVFVHPVLPSKKLAYIFDATGRVLQVINIEPFTGKTIMDVSNLSGGTYLLQYSDGSKMQVAKFIKQ